MAGYTIKNLMDIEDSAKARGGGVQFRFARKHIESEHLGVTRVTYEPNTRSPIAHSHREQEEVYLVLAGSGRIKLDNDVVEVRPWDVIRVAPTTVRAFHSGPDGLDVIAVGSDRPPDGDGV